MKAFLKLVRWPNLVFVFMTQILFEYCVILPSYTAAAVLPNLSGIYIYELAISSVLIAAGGNIINDYFDVNIDQINKPQKVIIGKHIHRHWAILWHILFSTAGVFMGFWIEFKTHAYLLGITNLACVVLLFVYSIILKRKPLSGNIVIASLTAWTVLVVTFCETNSLIKSIDLLQVSRITRLTFLYAGFAFIISLVREMVKDMEDMDGDSRYNCRTFPIIFGLNAAKVYCATWLIILTLLLLIMALYVLQFGWWIASVYCLLCIFLPSIRVLLQLFKSGTSDEFHQLSRSIKWIMLTGIFSLIFLLIQE